MASRCARPAASATPLEPRARAHARALERAECEAEFWYQFVKRLSLDPDPAALADMALSAVEFSRYAKITSRLNRGLRSPITPF